LLSPAIPLIKRIWTPSWAIFSAGCAYLLLAFFYGMIEIANKRNWFFIFTVVGMNSIAIYVFFQMMRGSINGWLWVFTRGFLGPLSDLGTIIQYCLVLAVQWYFVYWLYKRKIFLKVG
jgi:predicted acyltransferase